MTTAADRVASFLDERSKMRGLDQNDVALANLETLTVADLRELITLAREAERIEGIEALAIQAVRFHDSIYYLDPTHVHELFDPGSKTKLPETVIAVYSSIQGVISANGGLS